MIYLSFISVDAIGPDDYLKIRNKNLREQAASANNIAVRRERTASRILLEDILNRFYPKLDCDYPVRITEKRKPYIVGENVPYFSFTYSKTSLRLLSSKSTSKSGAETLSGFKNLSKNRPYFIGSTSVIPIR